MFDLDLGPPAQCRTLQRRSGLLENLWTASKFEMDRLLCRIGPTPPQGELRVKMSQSSVLKHV
jgi:hypothetical protein